MWVQFIKLPCTTVVGVGGTHPDARSQCYELRPNITASVPSQDAVVTIGLDTGRQGVCDSPLHQSGANMPTEAVILSMSSWSTAYFFAHLTTVPPFLWVRENLLGASDTEDAAEIEHTYALLYKALGEDEAATDHFRLALQSGKLYPYDEAIIQQEYGAMLHHKLSAISLTGLGTMCYNISGIVYTQGSAKPIIISPSSLPTPSALCCNPLDPYGLNFNEMLQL